MIYEVVLRERKGEYYNDDVTLRFPDVFQACAFAERALPHMVGDVIQIKKVGDAEDTAHDTHEQEDENDLPVL